MSERLILQDLVDLLSEKREITKKDAEAFLRELIALISENVEKNEPVKIKDFGTFKLVKVNSRKSVDVNTGEAIEIPAHYKVSFTPDKSLRDRVNAPFAHFESVVLEDGVTFDEKPDDVIEEIVEEEEKEEIVITETRETATQKHEEDKPDENSVVAEYISESGMMDNLQEEDIQHKGNEPQATSEEGDIIYEKSGNKKTILGVLAALLIIAIVFGWLYRDNIRFFLTDKGWLAKQEITIKDDTTVQRPRVTPVVDSIPAVNNDNNKVSTNSEATQQATAAQDKKEVVEGNEVVPDNSRQSEPVTTSISPGDTMRKLGLKYFGHKSFWVYIYEENRNKISDPNNVPLGTVLVIPPASKYGIDANNPESLNKAKRMEGEILSRY